MPVKITINKDDQSQRLTSENTPLLKPIVVMSISNEKIIILMRTAINSEKSKYHFIAFMDDAEPFQINGTHAYDNFYFVRHLKRGEFIQIEGS